MSGVIARIRRALRPAPTLHSPDIGGLGTHEWTTCVRCGVQVREYRVLRADLFGEQVQSEGRAYKGLPIWAAAVHESGITLHDRLTCPAPTKDTP